MSKRAEADDFLLSRLPYRVGDLSPDMIADYVQTGRRLRAEAFGAMLRAAWHGLRRLAERPAAVPPLPDTAPHKP
jgi:hypothetical protein